MLYQLMQRKFVGNLLFVLLLNLLVKPFWILGIDVAVQNRVGAEEYGFYYPIFGFSILLNIVLDLGITNYNNRNIAQHTHMLGRYLSGIFNIKLLLGVVYLIFTLILGWIIGYEGKEIKFLFLLGVNQFLASMTKGTLELEYAGAFNPLYLLRDGEIIQFKADKFPIGSFVNAEDNKFTNNKIQLEKGDQIYIFSDGYADQFGGPRGKKFMYKKFRDLLIEIEKKDLSQQKELLQNTLFDWMQDEEQVDDILVIGVRV